VLTPEQVKPFKAMMMKKGFYEQDLKKTLETVDNEVYMSRVGNSCSDSFVKLMTSDECTDASRMKVVFDPMFRQYLTENPVRSRSAVNFEVI
jgi:hypothetical protein